MLLINKKYINIYQFGFLIGFRIIIAYGKRFFSIKLSRDEIALIHHYNFILRYNLNHIKMGDDFIIHSYEYGELAMRKFPTSDMVVFKQVCIDKEYSYLLDLIKNKFRGGRITMIDGGANIGLTSIAINVNLGADYILEAVLIEPFDENLAQIKRNLKLQNIYNFQVIKAGITAQSGFLALDYEYRDRLEWSMQIKESLIPTDLVAIEICEIIDNNKWGFVDILKLDIEGSEHDLFVDREYAANFLKRVKLIAIEVHEEYISRDFVLEILREEGFIMSSHGELFIGYNSNLV